MFIQLRRRITECVRLRGRNTDSLRHLNRVISYLVLYPIIYIALTLPLATGRMANVTGHPFSVTYFCIAGSLIALSGLCDTVLYTLSRKDSILGLEENLTADSGSSRFSSRRIRSTLQNLRPSITDTGPAISTFAADPTLSDTTDESVPNSVTEYQVVDRSRQDMTIDMTLEQVRPVRGTGLRQASSESV